MTQSAARLDQPSVLFDEATAVQTAFLRRWLVPDGAPFASSARWP